jgi:hypothetical protein
MRVFPDLGVHPHFVISTNVTLNKKIDINFML